MDDSEGFWEDQWPENGDPESRELMEDENCAEGYIMTCCNARPNEKGCTPAAHQPASVARAGRPAKRARVE
jgi:hypothetical protein